tara:strand:- start:1633 stop:1941 length:309 start_codon:yes stop_codon:yes gene_type:complete
MSNVNFSAALFTNNSDNARAPQLTGFVAVPVSQIDQLIELLQSRKVFVDNGVDTVRIPLSFWQATGRAPLALKGQSSFLVADGTPITQTMSVVAVDPTPALA